MLQLDILFKEYIHYLEIEKTQSENTIISINSDLKQLKKFLLEYRDIEKLDDVDYIILRNFLNYIGKTHVTKRTIRRKISTLRGFFTYLYEQRKIKKNISLLIEFPTFKINEPKIIGLSDINKLRGVINEEKIIELRDKLLLELLYSTGIKVKEALSLGEGVINLEKREIRVIEVKSDRIVYFSNRSMELLKKYIELKKHYYKEKYNSDILFINNKGERLNTGILRKNFIQYKERAKINQEVNPIMFRHTFAVHMLKNGMSLEYVKELMGHSALGITKKYLDILKKMG